MEQFPSRPDHWQQEFVPLRRNDDSQTVGSEKPTNQTKRRSPFGWLVRLHDRVLPTRTPRGGGTIDARGFDHLALAMGSDTVSLGHLCLKCEHIRSWIYANHNAVMAKAEHLYNIQLNSNSLPYFPKTPPEQRWEPGQRLVYEHYQDAQSIEKSYRSGCHLCTFIWVALQRSNIPTDLLRDAMAWRHPPHNTWGTGTSDRPLDAWSETQELVAKADIRSLSSFKVHLYPYPTGDHTTRNLKRRGIFGVLTVSAAAPGGLVKDSAPFFLRSEALEKSQKGELLPWSCLKEYRESKLETSDVAAAPKTSPLSTFSQESINLILSWLEYCQQEHPGCQQNDSAGLPTRLLRVESAGQRVRLVETATADNALPPEQPDCRYAALSYCWGGQESLGLTQASMDELRNGILTNRLPQTIQDAVIVTHSLGLSWLWVDALCIIQDSMEDWKREARSMCKVYQGCFVCLAAQGATNSSEGLFSRRDPLRESRLPLFQPDGQNSIDIYPPWIVQVAKRWYPLERRGWVMQERILPPRTVRFATTLFWECRGCCRSEFGLFRDTPHLVQLFFETLLPVPGEQDDPFQPRYSTLPPQVAPPAHGGRRAEAVRSIWRQLLPEYSTLSLTNWGDRLIAIGGLAELMSNATGWEYFWGLWKPYMLMDLLWRPATRREGQNFVQPFSLHPTGAAPSWSWATFPGVLSMEDVITAEKSTINVLARVEACSEEEMERQVRRQGWTSSRPLAGIWLAFPPLDPQSDDCVEIFTEINERQRPSVPAGWPRLKKFDFHYDCKVASAANPDGVMVAPLLCHRDMTKMVLGLVIVRSVRWPGAYERAGTIEFGCSGDDGDAGFAYMIRAARKKWRLNPVLLL